LFKSGPVPHNFWQQWYHYFLLKTQVSDTVLLKKSLKKAMPFWPPIFGGQKNYMELNLVHSSLEA